MAGFLTPLDLRFIDGKTWELLTRFEYRVGGPDSQTGVIVPAGFLTDFASVPRGLWNIFPPTGPYGKAAVVHDFLYQYRVITENVDDPDYYFARRCDRAEADAIFNEAMVVLNVGRWPRYPVYAGVRVGGWKAYNRYRKEERDVELEW